MKLLKISVSGMPLFKEKCEINFVAHQRVSADNSQKMDCIFSNSSQQFYQNNVVSLIGINASGKTTILKLITFVCRMLNNESINNISCSELLNGLSDGKKAVFDIYFYSENKTVNLLHTVLTHKNGKLIIEDEYLKSKAITKVKNKSDLFSFDECEIAIARNNDEDFLLDDVSITVAYNKKNKSQLMLMDMLHHTDTNELSILENCPPELITFFDSNVEYLNIQKEGKDCNIQLKFISEDEISLSKPTDLNRYLSSGTIKGINIFLSAIKTFQNGGYLIVDEIENHFNQEIVSTLIRFYMDKKINPHGAVMIFSTHYAELLDELERNDSIYIVRNNGGIDAENLAAILKRNDIKKSEAYQSGLINGTTPMYDAYMLLKKSIIQSHKEEE
ncbi:MAG: ATP-binding protein [Ruminococcus sp.]|nr:ATP-binding protein [Ruminococcus sp.]MCM1380732.1 ATP-binding protein [Muribaculaceae bacterium]MCM1479150.1 ATP-binding protein [Muribaculaceae bacterium]